MSNQARVMWMRGGTSKGAYFLAADLPSNKSVRNEFLLAIMGSPDPRQIDGMGGADPLTSKVAVVNKSDRQGVDVDYLFLQVSVDQPQVSDSQNCGNILAGVGQFAIERGLVHARDPQTRVSIYMENTGQTAVATIETPAAKVTYSGDARIDGVPGTAAPVLLEFRETEGSICGALLPTGNAADNVNGLTVTMIDNGMPCVIVKAVDLGVTGDESCEDLDSHTALKQQLEQLRVACGPLMNLGDVTSKTVPKMTLVSPARHGGAISTRTFIPHRCHAAIGVLGAVSVATACLLEGSSANALANIGSGQRHDIAIEHLSGETTVIVDVAADGSVEAAAILRTARKLMEGTVFAG